MTPAPPPLQISDHGVVGDLRTVALVGTDGTVDWFCPGRFDAPSVFGAILDPERGGAWTLGPAHDHHRSSQFYFPDTNVLITRFYSDDGVVEVQDLMPLRPDGRGDEDGHAQRLVRRVLCVRGRMELRTEVRPRFDYGRGSHEATAEEHGVRFAGGEVELCLRTEVPLEHDGRDATATFTLDARQAATFVLHVGDVGEEVAGCHLEPAAAELFAGTVAYWRGWLEQSDYRGRWREMVQRSALTLKLLTYKPTGAVVAAATTSLPEDPGGERNWDYRYVWMRDAAFTIYALLRLGFTGEARAFNGWLADRMRETEDDDHPHGPLRTMYRVDGDPDLAEEELEHLAGYGGARPVRIGNGAADQLQLDIYGELIDSVYLSDKYGTPISHATWTDLARIVDWVCEHWDQPDDGIWETRGGGQEHTFSRLMCWVAIERTMRLARKRGLPGDLVRWGQARDAIYREIQERGYDEEEGYVQVLSDGVHDASLLLMPMVKFCSPSDPRFLRTLERIEEHLVADSLVYRYDPELSPDGLDGDEGTFSMCSFWYVEALTRAGRLEDARLALEKMFTYANHLGLYAEEVSATGGQLGNFPQGFTHFSLISAAYNLDRAMGD